MATVALVLALVWTMWQGHKAKAEAETAASNAALSWAFADGVLDDLKSLRADASRLDADRKDLIRVLNETNQERYSLKGEVGTWQQRHQALESETQKAFSQWTKYGERLEENLGSARVQLTQTSTELEQQRTAAEQERINAQQQLGELSEQKDSLAQAKANVEREADTLNRVARSLDSDNQQLQNEVSSLNNDVARLKNCVSSLEFEKSNLISCNASLASDNQHLKCEVGDLRRRIDCLEGELSRAKSEGSGSNSKAQR